MTLFLVLCFVGLLILSTPISMVLLATTAGALYFFLGVPLTALVQQLFFWPSPSLSWPETSWPKAGLPSIWCRP